MVTGVEGGDVCGVGVGVVCMCAFVWACMCCVHVFTGCKK